MSGGAQGGDVRVKSSCRGGPGGGPGSGPLWIALALLLHASPGGPFAAGPAPPAARATVTDDRVREIQKRAVVVDTHADKLWRDHVQRDDITVLSAKGQVDIP